MANPNPDRSGLAPPFKPGQSGNPGGISAEHRRLLNENAEKASRIRAALLAKVAAHIDPETGSFTDDMTADILRLLKDSEDRGLGAPTQTHAGDPERPLALIERRIVRPGD